MAIKVQCPKCEKILSAQDVCNHEVTECPYCGTKFRVLKPEEVRLPEETGKHQQEKAIRREQCALCGGSILPTDFDLGWAVKKENVAYHKACLDIQESGRPARPTSFGNTAQPEADASSLTHGSLSYQESGMKWIAIAIIIAALIIIGGYIGYTEYNKYQARKAVEELFDPGKR